MRDERFDDIPPGADVRVTQSRRELMRARRSRQLRRQAAGAFLFVALLILLIRLTAPQPPNLDATWPKTEKLGRATLQNGATVAIQNGQPFLVSIKQPQNRDVTWNYTGVNGANWPISWPPSGNLDKLEMRCRARAQGWQKAFSWLWPTRNLSLQATAPVALGERRYVVVPMAGAPVRLSSRVLAIYETSPEARWDERALPLLEAAARNAKSLKGDASWTIVLSPQTQKTTRAQAVATAASSTRFNDSSAQNRVSSTRTPGKRTPSTRSTDAPDLLNKDKATYAVLSPTSFENPVEALTQCAQIIAASSPQIGIKWIARENPKAGEPRAILWLDFTPPKRPVSKRRRRKKTALTPTIGARGGWFVKSGASTGEVVRWWEAPPPPKSQPRS